MYKITSKIDGISFTTDCESEAAYWAGFPKCYEVTTNCDKLKLAA